MRTLLSLEQRKHDLRVDLVKAVTRDGRNAASVQKVYRKLLEIQKAEGYLLRRG